MRATCQGCGLQTSNAGIERFDASEVLDPPNQPPIEMSFEYKGWRCDRCGKIHKIEKVEKDE